MRIVLLAYEVESFAMSVIGKNLKLHGHDVHIINGDSWHFVYKNDVKKAYNENGIKNIYNFQEEFEILNKSRVNVDWNFLKEFEKKYCIDKNLQQLIMSDGIINHSFREPFYSTPKNKNQIYYWKEIQIKWALKLFDEIKPDLIFTIERNYFIKNIFWQISKVKNIEMITMINSRLANKKIFVKNFGYGINQSLLKEMEDENLTFTQFADTYIEDYLDSVELSLYSNVPSLMEMNRTKSILNLFLNYSLNLYDHVSNFIFRKSKKFRGAFKSNYMEAVPWKVTIFISRVFFGRLKYRISPTKYFLNQLPDLKYIYYPLHVMPESSTLTLSNIYHEDDIIRHISNYLPVGTLLVVKENPGMIGIRRTSYYKQLNKLGNIVLLNPEFPTRTIIKNSIGVIGISGTSLLEAKIFRKPVLALGFPEFLHLIDSQGFDNINEFINKVHSDYISEDRYFDLKKYFEYILQKGIDISNHDLLYRYPSQDFENEAIRVFKYLIKNIC